jgi:AcrR family transcriptional regulator
VRLEDIGGAAGISGPAVYRHFASKDAVLSALLVEISDYLLTEGQRIVDTGPTPADALRGLIGLQVGFAVAEPELILIYDRDRFQLPDEDLKRVRRTQRASAWSRAATRNGRVT